MQTLNNVFLSIISFALVTIGLINLFFGDKDNGWRCLILGLILSVDIKLDALAYRLDVLVAAALEELKKGKKQ